MPRGQGAAEYDQGDAGGDAVAVLGQGGYREDGAQFEQFYGASVYIGSGRKGTTGYGVD